MVQLHNTFYEERKDRLAETDYITRIVVEHLAIQAEVPKKYVDLIEYRQELRDLPEQEGFDPQDPDSYEWPELP